MRIEIEYGPLASGFMLIMLIYCAKQTYYKEDKNLCWVLLLERKFV
jgi:hypothetical protein